jgi:hypothetical protein
MEEKSVLRWAGLAGMLAGIFFIFTIGMLLGFASPPATTAALVRSYPDHIAAITLGNTFYLFAVILYVPLFLALYRALRGSSIGPALFGSGLSLVGIVVFAAGAEPTVALAPLSDLYHASGATPADQATLVLLWQGIQGIFNELDTVSFVFMSIGFIVLGLAMLRAPAFGKPLGWISAAFGVVGVLGISFFGVNSASFAPFALLTFLIFPVLFEWKLYSLSRAA